MNMFREPAVRSGAAEQNRRRLPDVTAIAVINGERQPIGAIESKIARWVECDGRVPGNVAGPGVRYEQSSFVAGYCYRRIHAHVDVGPGYDL